MKFKEIIPKIEIPKPVGIDLDPYFNELKLISSDFIGLVAEGTEVTQVQVKANTSQETKKLLQDKLEELIISQN